MFKRIVSCLFILSTNRPNTFRLTRFNCEVCFLFTLLLVNLFGAHCSLQGDCLCSGGGRVLSCASNWMTEINIHSGPRCVRSKENALLNIEITVLGVRVSHVKHVNLCSKTWSPTTRRFAMAHKCNESVHRPQRITNRPELFFRKSALGLSACRCASRCFASSRRAKNYSHWIMCCLTWMCLWNSAIIECKMTSSAIKLIRWRDHCKVHTNKHRGERAQIDTDLAMTLTTTYDRNSESSNRILECGRHRCEM